MTGLAKLIADHLNFDMAGFFNVLFHVQTIVPKGGRSLHSSRLHGGHQLFCFPNNTHSPPASACSRFDDDWVTNFGRQAKSFALRAQETIRPRHGRDPCFFHGLLGGDFVAHGPNRFRGGSDKFDVIVPTNLGEFGVL